MKTSENTLKHVRLMLSLMMAGRPTIRCFSSNLPLEGSVELQKYRYKGPIQGHIFIKRC